MESLAYTHSYAAYEQAENIEYEFSQLPLFGELDSKKLSSLACMSLLSAALMLSVASSVNPTFARTIKAGTRGDDVAQVQTLLRNRGFNIPYGPDGSGRGLFGPRTQQAVRQFQAQVGLPVDGVVGPATLRALQTRGRSGRTGVSRMATASAPSVGSQVTYGARGPAVAELQSLLRNRNYQIRYGANGQNRGYFDTQTLQAVRNFQRDAGLSVDGVVGPQTWAALRGGRGGSTRAMSSRNVSGTGNYRVTASTLRIRSGPGTKYRPVGSLSRGAVVEVIDFENGWAQLDRGQYVSSQHIQKR